MYYKAKKRRDSRHWWRRIRSRKYRPLLFKKTIQVTVVTIALGLLAYLTYGQSVLLYLLYLLAWCLMIGIVIVQIKQELNDTQFLKVPRKHRKPKKLPKQRKIKVFSRRTAKTSKYRIDEMPAERIKTKSQKTSQV
jgi:hypothetical protein